MEVQPKLLLSLALETISVVTAALVDENGFLSLIGEESPVSKVITESLSAGQVTDPNGFVSTCNSTNFFIIRSNEVWTSSGQYCLHGITRSTVIDLCNKNGIAIFEKNFTIEDVHIADEVFVTGTFAGIIPVVSIDNIQISNGIRLSLIHI